MEEDAWEGGPAATCWKEKGASALGRRFNEEDGAWEGARPQLAGKKKGKCFEKEVQ